MKRMIFTAGIFASLLLFSCSGKKFYAYETGRSYKDLARGFAGIYSATPPQYQGLNYITATGNKRWIGTVNFENRKPNYVVLHHTAQNSIERTIQTFLSEKAGVSAHYIVGRDGSLVQMANDYFRSYHAGAGKWGNDTDLNSSSIGIELDNNGTTDPWPEVQINTLLELLRYLKSKYNIPQANFIAHADLAPTRKVDPAHFPWKTIAEQGYGYWYKDEELLTPPLGFDTKIALRIIGYDVRNLDAAIKAFKIHYIQKDLRTANLTEDDMKILYAIYQKFL